MAVNTANNLAPAKGASDPNAGAVATPAPTAEDRRSTSFGRGRYGANATAQGPSVDPGKTVTTGLDVGGNDDVMKIIQRQGLRSDSASPIGDQLRKIGDRNVPDAVGMASARSRQASSHSASASKVPDRTGQQVERDAPKP